MQLVASDFLGKLWVPATLGAIAVVVIICIAISLPVVGFMMAEMIASMSIMFRLTWDRKGNKYYIAIAAILATLHIISVLLLHNYFERSSGAVYMVVALIDAIVMVVIVRLLTRNQ